MSFQRCLTLASPKGGTMAATSSRYRNWTSRQRLRRGCQLVSPGGKMLDGVEQAFQQQGHQQLPRAARLGNYPPSFSANPPVRGDDFIRLKYRSICQRQRYQASTAVASSIAVNTSVQTKTYPASNRAVRDSFFCFLEARFRNARRSQAGRPAVWFDRHQPPRVVTPTMADDSRPLPNLSDFFVRSQIAVTRRRSSPRWRTVAKTCG